METTNTISLRCVFCFSTEFEVPKENYHPNPGELIRCANCGRMNDYDSMMRVVQNKAREIGETHAKEIMKSFQKKKIWK